MSDNIIQREPMAWSAYGGCASADPELFFPEPGADTSVARAICRACPVRRMCLDYAIETQQKYGIWGGMTENQRRRLRRDRHDHPARPAAIRALAPVDTEVGAPTEVAVRVAAPVRHLQLVR